MCQDYSLIALFECREVRYHMVNHVCQSVNIETLLSMFTELEYDALRALFDCTPDALEKEFFPFCEQPWLPVVPPLRSKIDAAMKNMSVHYVKVVTKFHK